jgi:DNA-binding transcriptional ArsR family regulator
VLEAAGLVASRREGRYKFHRLDTRPLERIADRWLERGGSEEER